MYKKLTMLFVCVGMLSSVTLAAYANENVKEDASTKETETIQTNTDEQTENLDKITEEGTLETPYDMSEVESPNPSLDNFELIAENEATALYLENDTLAFKVLNKETNYIWSSTIDNIEEENLNDTWQSFARSAVSITSVNGNNKEQTEYILDEKTQVDVTKTDKGFSAVITFPSSIQVTLKVEIENSSFSVVIPEESIKETDEARLKNLSLYPFLGATKQQEISGYQFIPDGSGALLRFDDDTARMDYPYRARFYGEDSGIVKSKALTDEEAAHNLSLPVYGYVHGVNQNGLFTIVESGAPYSEIVAQKAGLSTEFNWLTTEYIFRSEYRQPTSRSGAQAIDSIQDKRNQFDIKLHFELLKEDSASYVGMAKMYQKYLLEHNILKEDKKETPPVRLEFLGGEKEEGLFWDSYITMTPIMDVYDHVQSLKEKGLSEAMLVYRGWYDGGATGSLPSKFPIDSHLGKKDEVIEVKDQLGQLGFDLHFQTDYTRAYHRPTKIENNEFIEQINANTLMFNQEEGTPYSYLLPQGAHDLLEKDKDEYEKYGMTNLALKNTPQALFSSYNKGNRHSRDENMLETIELIEDMKKNTADDLALYEPNSYLWQLMDSYLDIPMDNSNYIYMTDNVPFIQIVLKGYVDYYAPFSNFVPNQNEHLLKMVEYGAYPSFYLTTEDPYKLIETESNNLYTSEFENWEASVLNQYKEIKKVAEATEKATIVNREIVEEGLIKVTYSNDTVIQVNYQEEAAETAHGTVDGKSFTITKGGV